MLRKEKIAVDTAIADEYDEIITETQEVWPMHVEMRRTVESNLHIFKEITLDRRVEAIVETKVVSIRETISHEAFNCRQTQEDPAFLNDVCRVVVLGTVNQVMHTKVDNFDESQAFAEHFPSIRVTNPPCTLRISHFVKQHT